MPTTMHAHHHAAPPPFGMVYLMFLQPALRQALNIYLFPLKKARIKQCFPALRQGINNDFLACGTCKKAFKKVRLAYNNYRKRGCGKAKELYGEIPKIQ
jgi:hypothetical protein